MRNLCDAALMSCNVAALPFQAHANYGTWSIDFDQFSHDTLMIKMILLKCEIRQYNINFKFDRPFIASMYNRHD